MDSLFDSPATTEEVGIGLFVLKLALFLRLAILAKPEVALLEWWKENACRFLNAGFLHRQILAIMGSQIETKYIFSNVVQIPLQFLVL